MRSFSGFVFSLASALALPLASAHEDRLKALQVIEYNIESAYTKFTIPVHVFELQANPTTDLQHSDVVVNAHVLGLAWSEYTSYTSGSLVANSSSGVEHVLSYVVSNWLSDPSQPPDYENATEHFLFRIQSIDSVTVDVMGYQVHLQPTSLPTLRRLSFDGAPGVDAVDVDFEDFTQSFTSPESVSSYQDDDRMSPPDAPSFDLTGELESLLLLESEAEELQTQIVAKKHAISTHLRESRDHVSLRHLLKECDGLVCAARVLAQRICDKVGVLTEPALGYARVQNSNAQPIIAFHQGSEKPPQTSRNCTKGNNIVPGRTMPSKHANGTAHELSVPLILTKNASAAEYQFRDLVNPPNPLVRALEIVASIIGIGALYKFIHRKCMSMRKRVERAADKEERRNRRAYRKAARRAEIRRQWDNLVNAVSCFRSAPEPRFDYEEKRALILQDAFLEQLDDLDQAEKGQIMEAEIRELRHAHEIVASLVRVDHNRYDLITPVNDPPPPLVPLPYTPETRSRASTGTLPSYTSESLPDYSSRPETLVGSSLGGSLVDGFTDYTPSTSDGEGRNTPTSISSGGRTRYTPTSSILDDSPRASEETLRTRQSKDTQDL
ncbi:hypothetical protein LTR36_004099 [Oleoguttula mirabilis]|uniref:Uncharacterized protein n=1 Tax=Oleoguttula mirabilis TaxID=1507867 RepID=A0AAV9JGN8_9PEZI|nr:hypothetical protein LTR36_004099 [Oleoguttula mirabilis]